MLLAGVAGAALVALVAGNLPATVALLTTAGAALAVMERRYESELPVLRARKIEVVGADGVTRVALGETVEGAGAVATYDENGRFVAALEAAARRASQHRHGRGGAGDARAAFPTARAAVSHSGAGARASQR